MSVTGFDFQLGEHGDYTSALGRPCFFCGQALTDPALRWSGFDGELFLHCGCLPHLFVRLARDVREILSHAA